MNQVRAFKQAEIAPVVPVAAPRATYHRPLGQVLVDAGLISPEEKLRTLEMQTRQDMRFGEILVARGLLTQAQVDQALAAQFGAPVADLIGAPPDAALIDTFGAERVLEMGHLPWRRAGARVMVASARPDQFEADRAALEAALGPVALAITHEAQLHRAILARSPARLTERAEARVAPEDSCRDWTTSHRAAILVGLGVILTLTALFPVELFYALLVWSLATLILLTAVNTTAWLLQLLAPPRPPPRPEPPLTRLPTVSILVALYQERKIAAQLIQRLLALDYPTDQLDICLVVEADDLTTQNTLAALSLPPHMRVIEVPNAPLRTKPRALNYALEFSRGSIVGIYDAEDAPEPDQIRKVAQRFHSAPQEVVCLQGILDYYNPHRNWISRCFTIEYATWFRLILPGFLRLGLVIPLGGTTLFFRRATLEKLGGWDAHNVTEDADLGVRLVRHGYRAELIQTVTREEANCQVWPWIKQRSRWLKGYAVTWAVHTRNPVRLWRDLGPWRFFGVQLLLLGTLTQFALAPLLWSFWGLAMGFSHVVRNDFGSATIWTIAGIFIASELLSIAIRTHAVTLTQHKRLKRWVPTLYVYFPMAAVASYKAALELLTRPFYWDKTSHGD